LFLDTDIALDRDDRVAVLSSSPYSTAELRQILLDEIYPVCRSNLFSIAGEWAGFDVDWLEQQILRRMRSPFRALHSFNLGRLTVCLSPEWRLTREGIRQQRTPATAKPLEDG
jgi:hypothetical protein